MVCFDGIMRKFFCNAVLFSALSLLGVVSFSPSLFGQEAAYPPVFGEWIPFPADNPHAAGSDALVIVDNTGTLICELRYVFLAADAPVPSAASIDANPDRETLVIAPVAGF